MRPSLIRRNTMDKQPERIERQIHADALETIELLRYRIGTGRDPGDYLDAWELLVEDLERELIDRESHK
jgi:hypothetical protein